MVTSMWVSRRPLHLNDLELSAGERECLQWCSSVYKFMVIYNTFTFTDHLISDAVFSLVSVH